MHVFFRTKSIAIAPHHRIIEHTGFPTVFDDEYEAVLEKWYAFIARENEASEDRTQHWTYISDIYLSVAPCDERLFEGAHREFGKLPALTEPTDAYEYTENLIHDAQRYIAFMRRKFMKLVLGNST